MGTTYLISLITKCSQVEKAQRKRGHSLGRLAQRSKLVGPFKLGMSRVWWDIALDFRPRDFPGPGALLLKPGKVVP